MNLKLASQHIGMTSLVCLATLTGTVGTCEAAVITPSHQGQISAAASDSPPAAGVTGSFTITNKTDWVIPIRMGSGEELRIKKDQSARNNGSDDKQRGPHIDAQTPDLKAWFKDIGASVDLGHGYWLSIDRGNFDDSTLVLAYCENGSIVNAVSSPSRSTSATIRGVTVEMRHQNGFDWCISVTSHPHRPTTANPITISNETPDGHLSLVGLNDTRDSYTANPKSEVTHSIDINRTYTYGMRIWSPARTGTDPYELRFGYNNYQTTISYQGRMLELPEASELALDSRAGLYLERGPNGGPDDLATYKIVLRK